MVRLKLTNNLFKKNLQHNKSMFFLRSKFKGKVKSFLDDSLFEQIEYYHCLIFFILIKILLIIISHYNDSFFTVDHLTDAKEYDYVAKSILDGKGYLSNENNLFERPFLGDNNLYSDSPMYPLILSGYYSLFNSEFLVILISNSVFQFILFSIFWLIGKEFQIQKGLVVVATSAIIAHGGINLYSTFLLAETFRVTMLFFLFFVSYHWINNYKNSFIYTIFFSSIVGLSILSRTPYVVIIFSILFYTFRNYSHRKFKHLLLGIFLVSSVLLPWTIRNYIVFDIFNFDVMFHKGFNKMTLVMDRYRLDDYESFKKAGSLNEKEQEKLVSRINPSSSFVIKLYLLKLKEFFRLYPSSGENSSISIKIVSSLFNLPYIIGIVLLFVTKPINNNSFWIMWKIFTVLFILFHLIGAGPHGRYFLPLVPIGYFYLIYFLNNIVFNKGSYNAT